MSDIAPEPAEPADGRPRSDEASISDGVDGGSAPVGPDAELADGTTAPDAPSPFPNEASLHAKPSEQPPKETPPRVRAGNRESAIGRTTVAVIIPVTCPDCSTTYRLPRGIVGKKVRCKKCQLVFVAASANGPPSTGNR